MNSEMLTERYFIYTTFGSTYFGNELFFFYFILLLNPGGFMDIEIVNPGIDRYIESLLPQREPWFMEMERMAAEEDFPAVGPQVGMLLEILARSMGARRIMELGSGFGYSGLWFAGALPEDGYLLLSDFEEKNRTLAESFFEQAGKRSLMEFRVGDALRLLEDVEGPFDIIFNDIDKELYPAVIEPVFRLLRKGGLFITDNALWYGRVVAENPEPGDTVTPYVKEFNERLKSHSGFFTTILPIRDGVSISLKVRD
jgi:caffeoyl-CoA O-methyltransferase